MFEGMAGAVMRAVGRRGGGDEKGSVGGPELEEVSEVKGTVRQKG